MIALGWMSPVVVAQSQARAEAVAASQVCAWCQYKASMSACRCAEKCAEAHCLSGELSLDCLPGTLHDAIPVPRFR